VTRPMPVTLPAGRRAAELGGVAVAAGLILATLPSAGGELPGLLLAAAACVGSAALLAAIGSDRRIGLLSAAAVALVCASRPASSGEGIAVTAAVAGAPMVLPLAAASLLRQRALVAATVACAMVAGPVRSLFYDPFLDPSCETCTHSGLFQDLPVAHLLQVGTGVAATLLVLAGLRGARRRPAVLVLAGVVAAAAAGPWLDPGLLVDPSAELLLVGAVVAAGTAALDVGLTLRARRRIERLVDVVGAGTDLTQILRQSLGDARLTVAYWLDDERRFATRDGGPAPSTAFGQVSTDLRVGGRLAARVHHAAGSRVAQVARALDTPTQLVLENERLSARLAARVVELAASRSRIVARADAERRTIERDVHDGAQQHVLALGFDLRVALASLPTGHPSRPVLQECLALTQRGLEELRVLSHGLNPPLLVERGLGPALASMARRSATAVDLTAALDLDGVRLPPSVERVAYALVTDAATRAPNGITVGATLSQDKELTLTIDGTVGGPAGVLADRVAALSGRLVPATGSRTAGGDQRLVAVIPCG